jgi:H+-transporting ATPase
MIAYDHALVGTKPVRWQMSRILVLSTILGALGVISSFLLLLILNNYFGLDVSVIRTLIFLKLAVAGHMTIYLARTGQQHFWEKPYPSLNLFVTIEVTQIFATLLAVYGIIIFPIGWTSALLIWGYALSFFFVNDLVKVKLFRFIHPYS